eukprot:TRINITY_DN448_c0_g8_i1.p1 TRINITY_DN448_c0_g8~~TRINITY_DN448_c0_g8_i1.p1  ORF type:complete len:103 (+),score=0.51 TRINITY_DN448_c0_g8_i1:855-1163(+)
MCLMLKLPVLSTSELNFLPTHLFLFFLNASFLSYLIFSIFSFHSLPFNEDFLDFLSILDPFQNLVVLGQALFLFFLLPFFFLVYSSFSYGWSIMLTLSINKM